MTTANPPESDPLGTSNPQGPETPPQQPEERPSFEAPTMLSGAMFSGVPHSNPPEPQAEPEPVPQPSYPPNQPIQEEKPMAESYPPPPPAPQYVEPAAPAKKNNKTIWIIVIVVVLLLCCCCIGIAAYVATQTNTLNEFMNSTGWAPLLSLL